MHKKLIINAYTLYTAAGCTNYPRNAASSRSPTAYFSQLIPTVPCTLIKSHCMEWDPSVAIYTVCTHTHTHYTCIQMGSLMYPRACLLL